jgi:hypothetical protein
MTPPEKEKAHPGSKKKPSQKNADSKSEVILPSDEQLHEAGEILVDSIELLGGKTDWTQ